MRKEIQRWLGAVLLAVCGAAGAQAQTTCAFANDNFPTANTVEGYMVTGKTAVHVSPVATGGNGSPTSDATFFGTKLIAVGPGTNHLYASDNGTNDIALFDINSANCQLTLTGNFQSGSNDLFGLGIAISPNGKFLYASNGGRSSTITVLKINGDGSLSSPVQTVSVLGSQSSMNITADGKMLITTQPAASNQVSAYSINPSSGKLKLVSTVSTIGAADGMAIDSHGKFIYVGNGGDGGAADVQVIEIGAGGKLTYFADNVFNGFDSSISIVGSSNCMMLSPNGRLLYFTNQVEATVTTLNVNPQTAALTFNSTAGDGEAFVDEPSQMTMNPTGSLIFTGDFNTDGAPAMGIFQAAGNGKLTPLGTFPLAQNASATAVAAVTF